MFALGPALGPAATISDPDELKKLKKTDKKRRQKMARNGGGGGGGGFMDLGRSLLNFLVGGNGGGVQAGTGMTTK